VPEVPRSSLLASLAALGRYKGIKFKVQIPNEANEAINLTSFLQGDEKHAEGADHQEDSHGRLSYGCLWMFFKSEIVKSPCTKEKR